MSSKVLKPWFIRHTKRVLVRNEDINRLFEERKAGLHFPEVEIRNGKVVRKWGTRSTKPAEKLLELGEEGGYVWSEYRTTKTALVGRVDPETEVEEVPAVWSTDSKRGEETRILTLQLLDSVLVDAPERMDLRSHRPRRGTISRWPSSGKRLEAIVEEITLEPKWSHLSTAQQEVVCSEFLRSGQLDGVPMLRWLLLPPGRTLKDIDIYGVSRDGARIIGQVTYKKIHQAESKIQNLRAYNGKETHLLFFCRCSELHSSDGIVFVPVNQVMEWAREMPNLGTALFPDVL